MAYQLNKQKMEIKSEKRSRWTLGKMAISTLMVLVVSLISFESHAESGQAIFDKKCTACHSITSKKKLGPGLGGINEKRSEEWLISWIKDSKAFIATGDADAKAIYEEFGNMDMQAFPDLSDDDIKGILAYIKDNGSVDAGGGDVASSGGGGAATGGGDEGEGTPMNTEVLFWGVIFLIIVGIIMIRFVRKVKDRVSQMGIHPDAHKAQNYPAIFGLFVVIAIGAIYVLVKLLETEGGGMTNVLMFLVLPYLSFAIFIIGSAYRYMNKGYQVSSLSSQFIEGKQLFWGSQPFHWGILILFVGHLVAFLFPSSVLWFNHVPARRLILELSSFAFGLSALLGLILLIKRRLTNKSLLVVTNKMDMVVYTVLLTQIVSGLGVAFFVRWGSSWFATVLTPYLRSIFSFDPDITSVSTMPWWIQLHIISAFLIIAIIPFTRFMHFLVAPIDYLWRKYQLVIWNWNRKEIRKSKQHTFGKKTRNH